jgi:hypothetical protein
MTWILLTATVAVLAAIAVACRRAGREALDPRRQHLRLVTTGEPAPGKVTPPDVDELQSAS